MAKQDIIKIEQKTGDSSIDIALSTIKIGKQAIIFVNTKRGAESLAEKISLKIKKETKTVDSKVSDVSNRILNVLSHPTKQCVRLGEITKYGIAFHHSGLLSAQRALIEENFKSGIIKIIVCTPSLAMGVDLPAFRVIIKDLKRFGLWGMQYIPVLEYEQQAGRAGRPSYDKFGEAICIADTEKSRDEIFEKYIQGVPEDIVSKLAVEPIMRTYILSLIASEFVGSISELEDFFGKTFYSQQYGDIKRLNSIIHKMLEQLEEWKFIDIEKSDEDKSDKDFVSALKLSFKKMKEEKNSRVKATLLGHRVSELYIDPYTANFLIENLKKSHTNSSINDLGLMHLICSCLELRPRLRVKVAEIDDITGYLNKNSEPLIVDVPEMFDEDYDEFLSTIKTTKFFMEWLDEKDEEYLFEKYDVRPGEITSKKDIADWLLYSCEEISKLLKMQSLIKEIARLRYRLKYGVREELIPLLQLKNIGRVRARMMFKNGIKDIADVKKIDLSNLSSIIGRAVALDIKKQVGQDLSSENVMVKENKRKGQINLNDFND